MGETRKLKQEPFLGQWGSFTMLVLLHMTDTFFVMYTVRLLDKIKSET